MPKWVLAGMIALLCVIAAVAGAVLAAGILFNRNAGKQAGRLMDSALEPAPEIIQAADLEALPAPVRKWLLRSKVVGQERVSSVRLKQTGRMRTRGDGPWMEVRAEQYFNVKEPGFVWKADVKMAPFVHLSGLDHFRNGAGKMNIRLLSLFPVVHAEGPEMDYSTLVRFLAEMQWFPAAALHAYITWEPVGEKSARATIGVKGIKASGVFEFNGEGDLIRMTSKRYRETNGSYVLSDWGGVNTAFKEFHGVRIPSRSGIIWYEPNGEFEWYQCEIADIEYNVPELY